MALKIDCYCIAIIIFSIISIIITIIGGIIFGVYSTNYDNVYTTIGMVILIIGAALMVLCGLIAYVYGSLIRN